MKRDTEENRELEEVQIEILGMSLTTSGNVVEMSWGRMQLLSPSALPVSAPLQIRQNDFLFLGEVVVCTPHNNRFLSSIRIELKLGPLSELQELRKGFSDSPVAGSQLAFSHQRPSVHSPAFVA